MLVDVIPYSPGAVPSQAFTELAGYCSNRNGRQKNRDHGEPVIVEIKKQNGKERRLALCAECADKKGYDYA